MQRRRTPILVLNTEECLRGLASGTAAATDLEDWAAAAAALSTYQPGSDRSRVPNAVPQAEVLRLFCTSLARGMQLLAATATSNPEAAAAAAVVVPSACSWGP
jgi:hypothetical protein